MKQINHKDYETMSMQVAKDLRDYITKNPQANICLATGNSPLLAYQYLVDMLNTASTDCSQLTFTKLDEWYPASLQDSFTCEAFIQEHVLDKLHQQPKQYISFDCTCKDPNVECARIQTLLNETPIDIMILGLGMNGHLGLNEPSNALDIHPHFAPLHEKTKTHTMITSQNIEGGLTLGLKNIFESKQVMFLACGPNKEDAYQTILQDKVSTQTPASFLHLHPDCTMHIDTTQFKN